MPHIKYQAGCVSISYTHILTVISYRVLVALGKPRPPPFLVNAHPALAVLRFPSLLQEPRFTSCSCLPCQLRSPICTRPQAPHLQMVIFSSGVELIS